MMRALRGTLMAVVLCALQGCFQTVPPPKPVEGGQYLVHVVSAKGENLPRLVQWYTGLKSVPQDVIDLNPEVSARPLRQGDKVLIPSKLVKRTDAPFTKKVGKGGGAAQNSKKARVVSAKKGTGIRKEGVGSTRNPASNQVETAVERDDVAVESVVSSGIASPPSQVTVESGAPSESTNPPGQVAPAVPSTASAGKQAKSVEEMLREEQAELERLKGELGEVGQ